MTKLKPIVSGMFYLPYAGMELKELLAIMNELTVVAFNRSATPGVPDEQIQVPCFTLAKPGYIGLPRAYGFKKFGHLGYIDRTVKGKPNPKMLEACGIKPRDKQQKQFMSEIANVCKAGGIVDYVANARTGSGKTVSDLRVSAELGVPTLIIVPTNKLKIQWLGDMQEKNGIKYFFGEEWTKKYVGIAQQNKCDYKGKLFVIGLAASLSRRDYGADFYNHFGKVTIDELHTVATPELSSILMKFPAAVRGGYTATNRDDSLRKICDFHLGKPKIVSEQEVLRPHVFIVKYPHTQIIEAYNEYQFVTHLAVDGQRNMLLANIIKHKGFDRGRQMVALSDRVVQLQYLEHILTTKLGIDPSRIGLHVGQRYIVTPHTCKRTGRVTQPNGKYVWEVAPKFLKKQKVKDAELTRIAKECELVLATYGTFALGVDIKRLDWGIELTPRSDVTQGVGRVIRENPGTVKPTPEWYSIDDAVSDNPIYANDYMWGRTIEQFEFFMRKLRARRSCYERQRAKITIIRSK